MKKETKELIKWIKEACEAFVYQSKDFKENLSRDKTCDEAIKFLESIPEIESHLCRGGYIQDKNGTPCCDGDKILFCGEYDGVLRFGFINEEDEKFYPIPHFWFDFGDKVPTASKHIYFEKARK